MTTLNRKFLEALARASLEADTSNQEGRDQFIFCLEYIKADLAGKKGGGAQAYYLQIAVATALACTHGSNTWAAARESIENVVGED